MPEHRDQTEPPATPSAPPPATPTGEGLAPPEGTGADWGVDAEPPIVHELTGPLRCVSCRYELRGLSIKGNCPECGLPVRATLLRMVDPDAIELQPVGRPRLVAIGLLLWAVGSFAALVTGVLIWAGITIDGLLNEAARESLVLVGAVVLGVSGLGALAIVRPHGGISRRRVLASVLAVLLYPLAVKLYADVGLYATPESGSSLLAVWAEETAVSRWRVERLCLWLTLALGAWLLRPNLRLLASRSLVLRSKRVDRQTIAATIAAMLIAAAGDAIGLAVGAMGDWAAPLALLSAVLVGLGVVLLALGALGTVMDTIRLLPAVLQPPLAIGDVIDTGSTEGEA